MCLGRKERKKNNPKISGHYIPLQRPRAAHALRSDQHASLLKFGVSNSHSSLSFLTILNSFQLILEPIIVIDMTWGVSNSFEFMWQKWIGYVTTFHI